MILTFYNSNCIMLPIDVMIDFNQEVEWAYPVNSPNL
jgi:hypothetical protein